MVAAIMILMGSFFHRFFACCTFLPQAKPLVTSVLVLRLATKKKEKIGVNLFSGYLDFLFA